MEASSVRGGTVPQDGTSTRLGIGQSKAEAMCRRTLAFVHTAATRTRPTDTTKRFLITSSHENAARNGSSNEDWMRSVEVRHESVNPMAMAVKTVLAASRGRGARQAPAVALASSLDQV